MNRILCADSDFSAEHSRRSAGLKLAWLICGGEPHPAGPTRFTPDPVEHLAQVRHARDVLGWKLWELQTCFARLDQANVA